MRTSSQHRDNQLIVVGTVSHLITCALIVLVSALCYLDSLFAQFHLDDFRVITDNPAFKFSHLSFSALVSIMASALSRAVTMLTFALNYAVGKEDVFGYHLVNMFLHGLTGVTLYALLFLTLTTTPRGMMGLRPEHQPDQIARWASLLWVAHPIQTQAVTYIVQRSTVLAAFFFLLTMLCYLKGRLAEGRLRSWWYLLGILMAGLAVGSKEIAITLPLALWLYEACFFTPAQRSPLRSNLGSLLLVIGAMGAVGVIYVFGAYGGPQQLAELFSGTSDPYQDFTLWQRLLTKGRVVAWYLSVLIVPTPDRLSIEHDMARSSTVWSPASTLPAWCMVGAVLVLAMMVVRRQRFIGYWLLWFFLNIAIESSLVGNELIFEHRLYLPSMGIIATLVVVIVMTIERVPEAWVEARDRVLMVPVVLAMTLFVASVWTIQRNAVWENEVSLWQDAAKKAPTKFRPHLNLGFAYELDEQLDYASREYRLAKQLNPSSSRPYHNLGWIYYKQKKLNRARAEIEQALVRSPSPEIEARLHRLLGFIAADMGLEAEALNQWKLAYRLEPELEEVTENLGWAYLNAKQWTLAKNALQEAITFRPQNLRARFNLGLALEKLGEIKEAKRQYRLVIEMGKSSGNQFAAKSHQRLQFLGDD